MIFFADIFLTRNSSERRDKPLQGKTYFIRFHEKLQEKCFWNKIMSLGEIT